ncbi:MAG: lipopolysaccharide biosynthesis protein [Candidatus Hodarchaeales archaeon]
MKGYYPKFILAIFTLFWFISIPAEIITGNPEVNVLVLTESTENPLLNRIGLDPEFVIEIRSDIPTENNFYDIIILMDFIVPMDYLTSFNGGVLFFIGSTLSSNVTMLHELGLSTLDTGVMLSDSVLPVVSSESTQSQFLQGIEWNSVPMILNYSSITLTGTILLETADNGLYPGTPLMSVTNNYVAINIWFSDNLNQEFTQWPFFNYFIYRIMRILSKQPVVSFADWKYSPVPHLQETVLLGLTVLLVSIVTVSGFYYARNHAKRNPLTEQSLSELSKQVQVEDEWEDVGMHRPLGGFFVQFFIGVLILLPNVVMTALVFPLLILPSPQAAGFYDFTIHFFEALWLLFDLGTSTAAVKFFSQYRVKRPRYAVRFIQIFVWYQMLSGVVQLFLISFLGSIIFPRTFLAHMSWVFVTHAFFQWPAFFIVFMLIFQAMNRLDLYQILNILLYAVFNITIQYLVILIFRATLGSNIIFGDALAGAIGYSVGNYVIMVAGFLVGMWFFKRLGFSVTHIFRVDFTWVEVKETLKFGTKWALGNVLPPLGWFLQVFLLSLFLPNYTEQQGFFSIAWSFALIVFLVALFAQSLLGGISESYHSKQKKLTQYYAVSSLKWGGFFDFFLVGALLAIGPKFIMGGAGAEWSGAAILIPWLLLFHAFGYLSWIGDWMFAGSDRPGWAAMSWILEQVIRAILLIIFVPAWEFFQQLFGSPLVAIMFAYIPALIVKDAFMWWGIRKSEYFRFAWKDIIYQGFTAPIISGLSVYLVLEVIFSFVWKGDIITSVIILLIGIIGGIYLFAFIYGLVGGFDDNTLNEFKRAAGMAKGVKVFSLGLYKCAKMGCDLSPLHNRFPITIYEEAAREAESLTKEKADLLI